MNTTSESKILSFYAWWFLSGMVSLGASLTLTIVVLPLISKVTGDFIQVGGVSHISEDYLGFYTFIPSFGTFVGLQQYVLLRQKMAHTGWWVLTAALGWALAWLGICLRYFPVGNITLLQSIWYFIAAWVILGIFIGLAQWLVLRKRLPGAFWWIPANALGFGIAGLIFGGFSSLYIAFVAVTVPCLVTGVLLWMLLEKPQRDTAKNFT